MFPVTYRFEIEGGLPESWKPWFEPLTVLILPNGNVGLVGEISDISMLYGIIARLRDFGLVLVGLERFTN